MVFWGVFCVYWVVLVRFAVAVGQWRRAVGWWCQRSSRRLATGVSVWVPLARRHALRSDKKRMCCSCWMAAVRVWPCAVWRAMCSAGVMFCIMLGPRLVPGAVMCYFLSGRLYPQIRQYSPPHSPSPSTSHAQGALSSSLK